ncbi:uncharacterized protein LOC123313280 [Coccinella septempunctata]|uniref:uncharacterized protein LOC123313280 n=1 Tax=Coccinella septempunctata TaxID=41139 RepID=UPI001D0879CA|nr:uncharacterized protein LOC123313280 [Coccinella septempunctata]
MFLSTQSIRPFVQNENPSDNTGFKKPGATKSGGLSLRTPFKDRSVNSVSPTSKYNSKVQMQKKAEQPFVKNVKCATAMKFQQKEEANDIYMDDFASYKELTDEYADIFPSKRLDILKFLRNYVSGGISPKYIPEDDEMDDLMELPVSNFDINCPPIPSPVDLQDVPLPVFHF